MKKILLFLLTFPFFTNAQLIDLGLPISNFIDCSPSESLLKNEMPNFDLATLLKEDSINNFNKVGPWRFGNNFEVNFNLENAGEWHTLPNGDRIWRLRIGSANAISINLIFNEFYLPEGSHVITYNIDKSHYVGAYTSLLNNPDEIIGSELVYGDDIIVEYFEPLNVYKQGRLSIGTVTHAYKQLHLFGDIILNGYDDSGNCNHDVDCPTGIGWENQINSVAMIVVGGNGACTGALINNTNNDGTPYFLTANHCLGNPANWLFRFNWHATTPSCGTTANSGNGSYNQTTFNSVLRASNAGSDFALVQINNNIPTAWNPYYAGWDKTDVAPTSTTGIHHPSGDLKKICRDNNAPSKSTYSGAACWEVSNWDIGVTEPGSSGSPLFDQNGRIIGQLYGGSAACNGTSDNGQPDFYGRIATSWNGSSSTNRLKDWLDPSNSNLTVLNGFDPNAAIVALDASISVINTPTTDICGLSFTPQVVLKNNGSTTLTSCQIVYQINGGALQTYSWSGSLATNATATINLQAMTAVTGSNTFNVFTQSPNNGTDQNSANDAKTSTFQAVSGATLPLAQTFQTATFPPTNYELINADNDKTWARTTTNGFNSNASMFLDNWDYDAAGAYDWFVLPSVNLAGTSNPTLTFDYAYAYYDQTNGNNVAYDSLYVAYSLDCGTTWTSLFYEGGIQLATAGGLGTEFAPTSNQWENKSLNLNIPALQGQNNVQFAFVAVNDYGNNLYIDNINIQSSSVVQAPVTNFFANQTSICAGGSVSFTSTSTNNPTIYNWTFTGGNPSSSPLANPSVTYTNPGVYAVSLTTSNTGGSDVETKTSYITVNALPNVSIAAQGATCQGINNGSITVTPSVAGSYSYSWSGGVSNSAVASNLAPGSYSVTITNSNSCSTSVNATVNPGLTVNVQLQVTDSSATGGQSIINSLVSGGTAPYSYLWNTFESSPSISILNAGTYSLTVTDFNGCQGNASASIGNVAIQDVTWLSNVSVYPNPASEVVNVNLSLTEKQDIELQVLNVLGQVIAGKSLINFDSGTEQFFLNDVNKGIYFLKISSQKQSQIVTFIKD